MSLAGLDQRLLGLAPGEAPIRVLLVAATMAAPAPVAAVAVAGTGVIGLRLTGSLVVAWQSLLLGVSLLRTG